MWQAFFASWKSATLVKKANKLIFLGRGCVRQNTTVLVSYLLRWRHVSATVGHPQVTKFHNEENYTVYEHK